MAVLCLLLGVLAGWFLRGSQGPANSSSANSPVSSQSSSSNLSGGMSTGGVLGTPQLSPQDMKRAADQQAQSFLDQIRTNPNDTYALTQLGNIYFDSKQYNDAIEYYARVLKIQPTNTNVRTDMGIAYWEGSRNADRAIKEFNTVLSYEPTKPQTLQSLGIVKLQGKADVKGAVAAWQKLLDTNPTYEKRADIQQLIVDAQSR